MTSRHPLCSLPVRPLSDPKVTSSILVGQVNGMRSVSRDMPGRVYRKRSASEPAVGEHLETSTTNRLAFSVHA